MFGAEFRERLKSFVKSFLFLVLPLTFLACDELNEDPYVVVSEDVLYVSSEQVRLVGRILSLGDAEVKDHGFQISTTESFNSTIKISLGERSRPGRFLGESSSLSANTIYYWRSFIETPSEVLFGETRSFLTLTPGLVDFTPKIGTGGDRLFINGKNFSKETEVFFNNVSVPIEEILFESQIIVRVPPISNSALVNIKVRSQGEELLFENPFEYIIGKWEKVVEFPTNIQLRDAFAFLSNQHFIVGLGRDAYSGLTNNKVWRLNLNTLLWDEPGFSGLGTVGPFHTDSGFFGSGALSFGINSINLANQFWIYSNGQLIRLNDLPFRVYKGIGFELDNGIYVLGGQNNSAAINSIIYRYNKSTQLWSEYGSTPVRVNADNASFSFDGKRFFLLEDGLIVNYNPQTNTWAEFSRFIDGRFDLGGVSIAHENKVFIGLTFGRDIWEFSPATKAWKPKLPFSGQGNYVNLGHFVWQNNIYILRRYVGPQVAQWPPLSLWKFDPNSW